MGWEAALPDELVKVLDPVVETLCGLVDPDEPIILLRHRLFWLIEKACRDPGLDSRSLSLQGRGVAYHGGELRSRKFINEFGPFDQVLEQRSVAWCDCRLSDAHLPPLPTPHDAAHTHGLVRITNFRLKGPTV